MKASSYCGSSAISVAGGPYQYRDCRQVPDFLINFILVDFTLVAIGSRVSLGINLLSTDIAASIVHHSLICAFPELGVHAIFLRALFRDFSLSECFDTSLLKRKNKQLSCCHNR